MAKTKEREEKREAAAEEVQNKGALALAGPPSLLAAQQPRDDVAEAFASEAPDRKELPGVPIARIDHDATAWLLDGASVDIIEGYPVHWFQARAWWEKGYNSNDTSPPDCWSPNMVAPFAGVPKAQSKLCATCKCSQFGTAAVGKGQACKTNTFLFVINPALGIPPMVCLILPPSSIRPLMGGGRTPGYLQAAKRFKDPRTGKTANYHELVWTAFRLEPGGDRHAVLAPEPLHVCPSVEEARFLGGLRKQMMASMEALRGNVSAVATGADAGGDSEAK